jgi:type III pantothenate kinase
MSDAPLVAVDIGNSSTKIGWQFEVSESGGLPAAAATRTIATGQSPPDEIREALPPDRCRWHVASVHREGTRILRSWLQANRAGDEVRILTHHDLPIPVRLDFPDRVGLDRLAAAVAANGLRSAGAPAIVVDAGSAITVDLVAADGAFEGGVILPGFRMSAQALSSADLLPVARFSPDDVPSVVGESTEDAIRSGLFWGAVGGVREIIQRMSADLDRQPEIFVTGGDLRRLAEHMGQEASFVPHMVLSGIALAATRG